MTFSSTLLTPHFSIAESTITSTGISNVPNEARRARILNTAFGMELVRSCLLRNPIRVSSWFRSPEVNAKVGGVSSSEHTLGAAVDFTCPAFGTPKEICKSLVMYGHIINYNQLIYENTWVHISFPEDGVLGKREVLTLVGSHYAQGIL